MASDSLEKYSLELLFNDECGKTNPYSNFGLSGVLLNWTTVSSCIDNIVPITAHLVCTRHFLLLMSSNYTDTPWSRSYSRTNLRKVGFLGHLGVHPSFCTPQYPSNHTYMGSLVSSDSGECFHIDFSDGFIELRRSTLALYAPNLDFGQSLLNFHVWVVFCAIEPVFRLAFCVF